MTRLFLISTILFSLTCKASTEKPFQAYISKREGVPFYIEDGKNLQEVMTIPYAAEVTLLAVGVERKGRNKNSKQWDRIRFLKTQGWIQSEQDTIAKKKPQTTLEFANNKVVRKLLYVLRQGERIIESEYSFAMNRDIDRFAILVRDRYNQVYLIRNSERVFYGDYSEKFHKIIYKGDTLIDIRSHKVLGDYQQMQESITVNGKPYPQEQDLDWNDVTLSEDGKLWGYQNAKGIYTNGKRVTPDSPSAIKLYGKNVEENTEESNTKKVEIVEKKDGDYIKHETQEIGPFHKVNNPFEFRDAGSFLVLATRQEHEELHIDLPDQLKKEETQLFIVTNEKQYGPYVASVEDSEKLFVSPKGKIWVLSYRGKKGKVLVVNGKKYGPYPYFLRPPIFSENEESWAILVPDTKNKIRLLVNGEEIPIRYSSGLDPKTSRLVISNDGTDYALLVEKRETYYLRTNKEEYGPFPYKKPYIHNNKNLQVQLHEKYKVWHIQYPTGSLYFVKDKDIFSNQVIQFFQDKSRIYTVKGGSTNNTLNTGPPFAGIEEWQDSYYANILGQKYGNADAFFIDQIQIDGETNYVWLTLEGRAIYGYKLKESEL
ncbi:MAG: hypothetical protein AAF518_21795 [Spirochaetota bacterium]